jgi:hypothetical protein
MRNNRWVTGVMVGLVNILAISVFAAPASNETFVGPFATWANVKTDYGAVGDGKADDTAALQRALDDMGTPTSKRHHLWLPAGTYRITHTLRRTGVSGVTMIGEDPATTIIRWDGPAWDGNQGHWKDPNFSGVFPSDMFWFNGMHSHFARLTFDGAGKAFAGFALRWNQRDEKSGQGSSHRNSFADVWFRDCAVGFDGGGKLMWLDSETLLQRCHFTRCSVAGASTRHFNACDWWFWSCLFEDCARGVTNVTPYYGGHFHVYESVFRRSTEADISIYHSAFFGIRDNVSVGSKRFFHAENNGANGATVTLQRNTIIDPQADDALWFETIGNVHLMDNVIASRPGTKGPVVRAGIALATAPEWEVKNNTKAFEGGWCPVTMSALGNTFTVANPFEVRGKLWEADTTVAPRARLKPVVPALPGVLPRSTERVFEVAGTDGAAIQAAIDAAVIYARQHKGSRPVVHLPMGIYPVAQPLTIPAGVGVQLVGDGYYQWPDGLKGTILRWAGKDSAGPVLSCQGPSKAVVSDLAFTGPPAQNRGAAGPPVPQLDAAIVVEHYDQPRGRVSLRECGTNALFGVGLLVTGLDHARVQVIAHEGGGYNYNWRRDWDKGVADDPYAPYPAVRVQGGLLARAGKAVTGRVELFGCNCSTYDVRDGGYLLVRDQWCENNNLPFHMFLTGNGHLTMDTCKESLYLHPTLKGVGASYRFKDFTGTFTMLNVSGETYENPLMSFTGDCRGARILGIGNGGDGNPRWLPDPANTAGATLGMLLPRRNIPDLPNIGDTSPVFVKAMLRHTRAARPEPLAATPAGITDLRFSRIYTERARVGLYLKGEVDTPCVPVGMPATEGGH